MAIAQAIKNDQIKIRRSQ